MKTHTLRISMIAMLAVFSVIAANAAPLRADIPFDFVLGSKTMPAGNYVVDHNSSATVVIVRSLDQRETFVMTTANLTSANNHIGKLVFHRYGDQYFLSEVWTTGSDPGRKLPQSKRERELSAEQRLKPARSLIALR